MGVSPLAVLMVMLCSICGQPVQEAQNSAITGEQAIEKKQGIELRMCRNYGGCIDEKKASSVLLAATRQLVLGSNALMKQSQLDELTLIASLFPLRASGDMLVLETRLGGEASLSKDAQQIDIAFCMNRNRTMKLLSLQSASPLLARHPVWSGLFSFIKYWEEHEVGLLDHLWMEMDVEGIDRIPIPGIFFGSLKCQYRGTCAEDRMMGLKKYAEITGFSISDGLYEKVNSLLSRLAISKGSSDFASPIKFSQLGIFHGREDTAAATSQTQIRIIRLVLSISCARIETSAAAREEIHSVLFSLGWDGDVKSLLLDWLFTDDLSDVFQKDNQAIILSVDVSADGAVAIQPKVGIELRTRDVRGVLSRLAKQGLCSSEREKEIAMYLGLSSTEEYLPENLMPRKSFNMPGNITVSRGLSHIKVVVNEKRLLEAKVYLSVAACDGETPSIDCPKSCAELYEHPENAEITSDGDGLMEAPNEEDSEEWRDFEKMMDEI